MKNSKFANPIFNKSQPVAGFLIFLALVVFGAAPRTMGQVADKAPDGPAEKEQIASYKQALEKANDAIRKQNAEIQRLDELVAQLKAQIKVSPVNDSNQLAGK